MGLQLSLDDIRGLAALERKMDSGEQPYVCNHGHRLPVSGDILSHLGCVSGQTVSDQLVLELVRAQILQIQHKKETQED